MSPFKKQKPRLRLFIICALAFSVIVGYSIGAQTTQSAERDTENLNSSSVTVCFTPEGNCRELILSEIEDAKKTLDIAIYSLTNLEISSALVAAKSRGIDIRVITDNEQSQNQYSKAQYLADSGIPVRYDGYGYMHHKFAIIDNAMVITGSYNWSNSAETRNDENVVFIRSRDVAETYTSEFDRLWERYR